MRCKVLGCYTFVIQQMLCGSKHAVTGAGFCVYGKRATAVAGAVLWSIVRQLRALCVGEGGRGHRAGRRQIDSAEAPVCVSRCLIFRA
jgi:hypothetical protein